MSQEVRKLVETYQVIQRCDCGGEFKPKCHGGVIIFISTNPPQFPHLCDKCQKTEIFNKTYPHVTYETREGEDLKLVDTQPCPHTPCELHMDGTCSRCDVEVVS